MIGEFAIWAKGGGKKSAENIWKGREKVFIFAPALRETAVAAAGFRPKWRGSETFWEDLSKRFGRFGKGCYFCSPQGGQRWPRYGWEGSGSFRIEKKSWKKIWRFQKKCLSLHHFPLKKRRSVQGRRRAERSDRNPGEIRNCSYSHIRTAFFEVIEQLKFSTLEKEWFQTIPLRFELKI